VLPYFIAVLLLGIVGLISALINYARRVRLLQETSLRQRIERKASLDFLNKLGADMTSRVNLRASLDFIVKYILKLTKAEAGAVFLFDRDRKSLRPHAVVGVFPPLERTLDYKLVLTHEKYLQLEMKRDTIKPGEGLIGEVAQNGQSLLIADCLRDSRVPDSVKSHSEVRTLMATPLRVQNTILGVLCVVNKTDGPFDDTDLSLLETLSFQTALTVNVAQLYDEMAEKQRIEHEIALAGHFQEMLLPKNNPQIAGLEITGMNRPATHMGGDFYDFIPLDEHRLGIVIADVSGKGIPAAIIMTMARSIIRAQRRLDMPPHAVLHELNRHLLHDTARSVFVTMTYGILDIRRASFRFCRAGHEPLIGCPPDDSSVRLYTPHGLALGLLEEGFDQVTEEVEIPLQPGELYALYTDGVSEAMNPKEEEYGRERMIESLRRHAALPIEEIQKALAADIEAFACGAAQNDDITMVLFRIKDAEALRQAVVVAPQSAADQRTDSQITSYY